MRIIALSPLVLAAGCQLSPIPSSIGVWHDHARRDVPVLERVLKEGDIVFRLSKTQLAGGLLDFSKAVADATESRMSHAALVYRVQPDGVVLVDVTPAGTARRYLIDWYFDGSENIVVRRLKPEYADLIPRVMAELQKLIAEDVLYDDKFVPNDDRYYCTELVDYCFRATGHPLASRIRIKDLPQYGAVMHIGCILGGIDNRNEVAIAGNERIGLFSSPMLETVLDLRVQPDPVASQPRSFLVSRRAPPSRSATPPRPKGAWRAPSRTGEPGTDMSRAKQRPRLPE
jgi:hypothetical protein